MVSQYKNTNHGNQAEVTADRQSFWDVTLDCLVAFQGKSVEEALELIRAYRARARKLPPDLRKGVQKIVYHYEPFHLACRLGGTELDPIENMAAYEDILKQHGYPV